MLAVLTGLRRPTAGARRSGRRSRGLRSPESAAMYSRVSDATCRRRASCSLRLTVSRPDQSLIVSASPPRLAGEHDFGDARSLWR